MERPIDYPFRVGAGAKPRWRRLALSLGWMAFPLASLFTAGESAPHVAATLAGWVAFVLCYGRTLVGPWSVPDTSRRVVLLLAGAAIAAALVLLDRSDWSILYIFLAIAAAARLPRPLSYGALVLAGVLAFVTGVLAHGEPWTQFSITASAIGIGFLFVLLRRLALAYEELNAAQEQLAASAVDAERLRFARDLHDLLGHSLSVISLKAQLAGRLLPDHPGEAATHVEDLQRVSREALHEVRAAVSGYARPTLAGELAGARAALEAAGVEPRLSTPPAALPAHADEVLAWAVREGTTNVLRHAGASSARITVAGGGATASVEVHDDGAGSAAENAGRGLTGLRERVAAIGGRVEAGPASEGGFRLRVEVPLA